MYEKEINPKELEILKITEAQALAILDFSKSGMPIILEEHIINI